MLTSLLHNMRKPGYLNMEKAMEKSQTKSENDLIRTCTAILVAEDRLMPTRRCQNIPTSWLHM